MVVANELSTRKEEVTVVTGNEKILVCRDKTQSDSDVEEPLIELIVGRHSAYVKDSDWWLLRQATDTQHTFLTRFEVLYAKRLHRGGIVKVPVFLSFFIWILFKLIHCRCWCEKGLENNSVSCNQTLSERNKDKCWSLSSNIKTLFILV